jgi:Mg2+ and Co2+ transporter CorA
LRGDPTIDSTLDCGGSEPPALFTKVARLLNEEVMGFLALVALATALGPLVFDVSTGVERALTILEWGLVTAFATELFIQGAIATDRTAWMRSPWRIVDALTVVGPVLALLPQVSDLARGSLMLRVLRIGRAVAFGTRAGSVSVRNRQGSVERMRDTTPRVSVVWAEGDLEPASSDWDTFLAWTREPGASWFHASDLNRHHFSELAHNAGVSELELDLALREDGHAKLREGVRHATVILQIPTVSEVGFPAVHRDRLLAIVTDRGLFTATTGSFRLQENVELRQAATLAGISFPVRVVCALLTLVRKRYLAVAQRFDEEVRRLEASDGGRVFLRETFRLRREISTATLDLWHLKAIVRGLADGKTKLRGVDLRDEKYLDELIAETDSLYETVEKNKEELKTLIELHINFKSFEMNSFLKLLAIVSFLGLIPSVAGGLLGMNVAGNPWPVTLGQVAFGVVMAMATALYVFAVKGWLK